MNIHFLEGSPAVQDYVEAVRAKIRNAQRRDGADMIPRYGLLAEKAAHTPVLGYGHPALKIAFPLGFHDGEAVFLPDDLCTELALDQSEGKSDGILPLVLLHLVRQLLNHPNRLRGFPDGLAQLAGETSAYAKLREGFPRLRWAGVLKRNIPASRLGMTLSRYAMTAEETIAREIAADRRHRIHAHIGTVVPTFSRVPASMLICRDELDSIALAGLSRATKRL